MLKLTWIELLLRTIPEMLILIWGIHVLSRKCLNIRNYIFSSLILAVLTFFVRWLPIYFGVHMIINTILIIGVMVVIGISIIRAICNTLLMIFILSLSEFINMIILSSLQIDTSFQFAGPVMKCVFGSISLVITLVFILAMSYLLRRRDILRSSTS